MTPGPYIIVPPGGPVGPFWGIVNQRGNVVAMQITTEEDAVAIRALPDLLAACEQAEKALEHPWDDELVEEARIAVDAALSKAQGEQP